MRQPQGEFSIIGQEKQSFTGEIQPAHRIYAPPFLAATNHRPSGGHARPAGNRRSPGLVQDQVQLALASDRFAVHRHLVVVRVHLRAEQTDRLAVHRHATFEDDLFAGATRRDPRVGQKFLETNVMERGFRAKGRVRKSVHGRLRTPRTDTRH